MKTKMALSALAGFAAGIFVVWLLFLKPSKEVFANQYCVSVMDMANIAIRIRAGKQMQLVTNIEARLPDCVMAVDHEFKGTQPYLDALWMVKAYYDWNDIKAPEEIRGILQSLPPRPPTSCMLRLQDVQPASGSSNPAR